MFSQKGYKQRESGAYILFVSCISSYFMIKLWMIVCDQRSQMGINMNYQKELEAVLEKLPNKKLPNKKQTLLLHSCCAPCSSYVLEYLSSYFNITVFYYNPNISEEAEYQKRVAEQKRLIRQMNERDELEERAQDAGKRSRNKIQFIEGTYEPMRFYEAVKGLEKCKEGGERCRKCFQLRLEETAKEAAKNGFAYFATTLTISPLKNAEVLNTIGEQIAGQIADPHPLFLPSDFKKKNGYKRSIELSREYDLYRQDYCGCVFSRQQ